MEFVRQYSESKKRSDSFAQNYDRKKIMISKGGKTYNLYDSIQAAREDTEIYPTLEKYGSLECMEKKNVHMIYADVSEALDLQGMYNQDLKLQEVFDNLPSRERNIFNNDFYTFKENGLNYYKQKAEAELQRAAEIRQQIEEQKNQPQKVVVVNKEDK